MLAESLGEAFGAEFLSGIVGRLGYAVAVERENVSDEKLLLPHAAIPFCKESQYGGRGVEMFQGVVAAEEKSGQVPAVRVA